MNLHVWKNHEGLHLARPETEAHLTEVSFDPDQLCRQCGEHVLSISSDHSNICPWCESGANRPKILRYQELEMVRLLQKQSDENKLHIRKKRSVISNRSTEKDIRDYLSSNGYFGNSANVLKLELVGIERPGWVQLFEFHVMVKHQNGKWEERFGSCRSDERSKSFDVQLFETSSQQSTSIRSNSSEMITAERGPQHWSILPLMLLFGIAVTVAAFGAAMSEDTAVPETAKQEDVGD